MKKELLEKVINRDLGKYIFFPLDFGFYKYPTDSIKNIPSLVANLCNTKFGVPMLHKGLINYFKESMQNANLPYFMHITGSTGLYKTIEKVQVGSVKEAKKLGAIGVSTLIYLGNPLELKMLETLARISEEADKEGILLYTMIYVANNKDDAFCEDTTYESIKYASRIAYEIGVDIVETRLPENTEDFVEIKNLCPISLILGDRSDYSVAEYIEKTKLSIKNGYDGVSVSARSLETEYESLCTQTRSALTI